MKSALRIVYSSRTWIGFLSAAGDALADPAAPQFVVIGDDDAGLPSGARFYTFAALGAAVAADRRCYLGATIHSAIAYWTGTAVCVLKGVSRMAEPDKCGGYG